MCKGNGNCPEPTSKMLCILNLFFEICLALNSYKFRRVYNSTNSFIVNLRFKKTLIIDILLSLYVQVKAEMSKFVYSYQ